ncbi:hypothetical protein B0H13DRAFT_2320123 [Mycena leptocephala]|nr:hypothetical protein B0H13DRAFT_1878547 [Mycena leptocephala]KAJ7919832.1 hypothetical protein B0H13DRAFT_2320123 [Mycena leptocephala]
MSARPLGELELGIDFKCGPTEYTETGDMKHWYIDIATGRVLRALVIGVVREVFDLDNGVQVVALARPDQGCPLGDDTFDREIKVLQNIISQEHGDTSIPILNRQHWSHDPAGVVLVRLQHGHLQLKPLSLRKTGAVLSQLEVLASPETHKLLETGALVEFEVELVRVDAELEECLITGRKAYGRLYMLDAFTRLLGHK